MAPAVVQAASAPQAQLNCPSEVDCETLLQTLLQGMTSASKQQGQLACSSSPAPADVGTPEAAVPRDDKSTSIAGDSATLAQPPSPTGVRPE